MEPLGELPKPRYSHTGTVIGKSLYIFGGYIKTETVTTTNTNDLWRIVLEFQDELRWENI